MIIEYIHFSEPSVVKTHDTVKSRRNSKGFVTSVSHKTPSQEEWDAFIIKSMDEDMAKGHILSYKIIEKED